MSIITSVVAHIDHGKTTLLDSLLSYTNTISYVSAGDLRYLDTRGDEQSRGITLKLSVITIPDIKMTFIDTPGHIDLHHYVLDCNSLVDTTLLLIDANEGITPRTFSLLTDKPTTIFINKIDKLLSLSFEDALFRIEEIICRIQGMFDQKFSKNVNLFDWKKNNVILGSTKYCFGVNFHIFSKFKKESTIKSLLFFVFKIKEALELKKDLNIFKENKIISFNLKGVFGKLFPICESIFFSNKTIFKAVKENKFTSLISTYSINYSEKILFVTRMFGGFIKKEDLFLCVDFENNVSFVKLENIFMIRNERLEEIDEFEGSGLIGLQGKFAKKCNLFKLEEISQKINISEKEILEMKIEKEDFFKNNLKNNKEKLVSFILKYKHPLPEERIPFYSKIIILNNLNELFLFKELFKKIGKTESSLSVILNKFNEFEINTQGKVHLEKILYDFNNLYEKTDTLSEIKLINHGKGFFLTEKQGSFVEGSSKSINFTNQEIELKIEPIENEECEFKGSTDLSESILINFINTGLLIKEKIKFTKFFLKTDLQDYSKIKNYLTHWYKESEPMVISQHIKLHCDIPDDQLNNLYPLINTYDGLSQVISYDDYYKIEVILPVIFYNDFIEKVSINCKGTVYLQPKEYLFIKREKDLFKKYEEEIKIKKGIEMLSLEE